MDCPARNQINTIFGVIRNLSVVLPVICTIATPQVFAQSIVIQTGQTATTTQTLTNVGDTLTIQAGGSIQPGAAVGAGVGGAMPSDEQRFESDGSIITNGNDNIGIVSSGQRQTLNNRGTITTNGAGAYGINILSDGNSITSSGSIAVLGAASIGIRATGNNNTITNSGSIAATFAFNGTGIVSFGNNNTVTNTGTISIDTSFAAGMSVFGNDNTVVNAGTITTVGSMIDGIRLGGARANVTNTGTITTQGNSSHGINSSITNSTLAHTGTIIAQGANAHGILTTGTDHRVVNSGTIISQSASAIHFSGVSDDILILQNGSILQGGLVFGGGNNTLEVGNGQSIHYTFDAAPDTLITNGAPSIVQGAVVDTIDTSSLANTHLLVSGIVDGPLQAASGRISGQTAGVPIQVAQATLPGQAPTRDTLMVGHQQVKYSAWLSGGGSVAQLRTSAPVSKSDIYAVYAATGFDMTFNNGTLVGAYVATTEGALETQGESQRVEASSFIGGIYAGLNEQWGVSLSGGVLDVDYRRQVLNNQVIGGIQQASASADGFFAAPQLQYHAPSFSLGSFPVTPSTKARYIFQHVDAYTETGSSQNLAVGSRNIHQLQARAQISSELYKTETEIVSVRTGLDAATILGDQNVSARLAGTSLDFDPGAERSSIGGFGGVNAQVNFFDAGHLSFDTEVGTSTEEQISASGRISLQFRF